MNFSFTPQINLDSMKNLGNLSAKAIVKVFLVKNTILGQMQKVELK